MQSFPVHIAAERFAPFPAVDSLPVVEAESALDAAVEAFRRWPITFNGPEVWVRVILTLHADGSPRPVLSVPITVEGTIPLDWTPPAIKP